MLRDCHLHRDYQHILKEVSPSICPPDILGALKGVLAFAESLLKSNSYKTETNHR